MGFLGSSRLSFFMSGAPGTTTRAINSVLGLQKTLLGVDVIKNHKLLAVDVNECQLIELLDKREAKIIISPIGGQGFLMGVETSR